MKNQAKIIVLWGIILIGLIIHALIEMMPLFFGQSIAMPDATGTMPDQMAWMMLLFFLLPMVCIVGVLFCSSNWIKITNLLLAALFMLLNLVHFISDGLIAGSALQSVLLIFVLFSSVLLFIASLRWKKETTTK